MKTLGTIHRALIVNGTFLEVLDDHLRKMIWLGFDPVTANGRLAPTAEQVFDAAAGCEVIIGPGNGLDERLFQFADRLKIISVAASGYECVDVDAATRAGVLVINAPTLAGSEAVADLALGLIIDVARSISQSHHRIVSSATLKRNLSHQPRPIGCMVWGKTLGILGLGAIGKAVARRACGFDMRIVACGVHWDEEFATRCRVQRLGFEDLLRESDFLSLHLRDTPETRGIIGARELKLMKPTAYLINTARASLVDPEALYSALSSGMLAGAALDVAVDVPENKLIDLPNVISTPHLGNRCREGIHEVMETAIDNAAVALCGDLPRYVVNPEVLESWNLEGGRTTCQ